jgi:hypothetical protein
MSHRHLSANSDYRWDSMTSPWKRRTSRSASLSHQRQLAKKRLIFLSAPASGTEQLQVALKGCATEQRDAQGSDLIRH